MFVHTYAGVQIVLADGCSEMVCQGLASIKGLSEGKVEKILEACTKFEVRFSFLCGLESATDEKHRRRISGSYQVYLLLYSTSIIINPLSLLHPPSHRRSGCLAQA